MFTKVELPVSYEMYLNSRPMMYFCRLLGYFPLSAKRQGSKVVLKWSPYYALYSFALGTFLIVGAYWQGFKIFVNNPKYPMTPIHLLTIFVGYTGWIAALFRGVFVIPNRLQNFFSYIKCLNKIDSIMKTVYTKKERYLTFLKFLAALTPGVAALGADFVMTTNTDISTWDFVKIDGILYTMQVVSTTVPYIVQHLVLSLEKRLCRLNQLLELESLKQQQRRNSSFHIPKASKAILHYGCNISMLMETYSKLCDAANLLEQLIHETITVGVVGCAIQLLHPVYFLIIYIDGSGYPLFTQAALMNVLKDLTWEICIIDSCYACSLRIKETEKLVCRLLCWNARAEWRIKIKRFTLCLGLHKIEFSACGFFTVNRLLFTNMLSTYTTVLMLLLQMHNDEGVH